MVFIPRVAAAAGAAAVTLSGARAPEPVIVPLKYRAHHAAKTLPEIIKDRVHAVNGGFPHREITVRQSSGQATNVVASYVASVSIGGTSYSLTVDSGSSNTWCGAQNSCEPSSSGQSTGNTISVGYGSGNMTGNEYTDVVSYGGLTVQSQSIGAATSSSGFNGVDGIIGIGPVDLTQGTVANTGTVPTFMDNLYSQGSIPSEVIGIYFEPESGSDNDDTNGELTLGGTDSSKYSGDLQYVPTLQSGAASAYWGVAVDNFAVNGQSLGSSQNAIVDTGTTLIAIPDDIFNSFLSATGGTNTNGNWATWSSMPTATFTFTLGSMNLDLTPDQYVAPAAQAAMFGLPSGSYYGWITTSGASSGGSSVDTIIGQKFIEQYYTVLDTTNQQVGFASH